VGWKEGKECGGILPLQVSQKTACRNEGVCFMVRFRVTIESR